MHSPTNVKLHHILSQVLNPGHFETFLKEISASICMNTFQSVLTFSQYSGPTQLLKTFILMRSVCFPASPCPGPTPSKVVLCYYEGQIALERLDPCLCSHLVLTSVATINPHNYTLDLTTGKQIASGTRDRWRIYTKLLHQRGRCRRVAKHGGQGRLNLKYRQPRTSSLYLC